MQIAEKKFTSGEIFEIEVEGGWGYFQYIYTDDVYSACVRVLPGVYDLKPKDIASLVTKKEIVTTFFPLTAAYKKGLVKSVGKAVLPVGTKIPPLMRMRGAVMKDRPTSWFLWEGDNDKIVKLENLTDEHGELPILGIANDNAIREMIQGTRKFD